MSFYRPIALTILCTALVLENPAALAAPKPTPSYADVSYGPNPHQLLDIFTPPDGAGPFPVVIWFGGLWAPSKGVPDLNRFFPAHCAVIGVETRVMGEGMAQKVPAPISFCLLDARRALQFVRLHAADWNLDPNRRSRRFAGRASSALSRLRRRARRSQVYRPRGSRLHQSDVCRSLAQPAQHRS